MNKEKYLKELEKRLEYLTPEQKQEEIFRISNELDNGKVINDISLEVKDIYAKYKIDTNKEIKKSNNKLIMKMDVFSNKIKIFIVNVKKKTPKEKVVVLRDILIITLIISILKIPFIAVETVLFSIFGNIFNDAIFNVIHFIIEMLYIIFAIFTFIKMFNKRFKEELE